MRKLSFLIFCLVGAWVQAQLAAHTYNKTQHNKEIIGYFTNWDAWKGAQHGVPKGFFNQLNIDYSQYTMLNWSFLGVAQDGSLHSGDLRNQQIHQPGAVQAPGPMFWDDIYSSWDYWLLHGELEVLHYVPDNIDSTPNHPLYWVFEDYNIKGNGSGWKNTLTQETGDYPVSLPKPGGAPGLKKLTQENDVKLIAALGGWSMSKHFPEVAASPVKRARFIADCVKLMDMGFDGIDIDWEFPGPFAGMNFVGSVNDYANFETLVIELRAAIGDDKIISAAFNASPEKLNGFNWTSLSQHMDYFNMMSYDMHGGWSTRAGHNSPLYPYTNAEAGQASWDDTYKYLTSQGVNPGQINMGVGFYGRGVVTDGAADLNAPTVKVPKNISPDGPVMTAGDFTNWGSFDATPFYNYIIENQNGWTKHWDDEAKVPYMTKDNYFLSYDDEQSIQLKSEYVNDNNIAGVIVWQVFGDLAPGTVTQTYANKLPFAPGTQSPLINVVNRTFAGNSTPINNAPVVAFATPNNNATIEQTNLESITITATATDDNAIASLETTINGTTVNHDFVDDAVTINYTPNAFEELTIVITATDNEGLQTTASLLLTIAEEDDEVTNPPSDYVHLTENEWNELFPYRFGGTLNGDGSYDISDDFYSYANFLEALERMNAIEVTFERKCATNLYKITRKNKLTGETTVIREDTGFSADTNEVITQVVDYGKFSKEGDSEGQKRELMAFLANIAQETTGGWPTAPGGQYAWGLHFNEEQGYAGTSNIGYVEASNTQYPATVGKSYHGRGPIQLSWNYNYGQVSEFLYGDKQILLDNPERVTEDGALAFQTAIWFWMTPQYPKPSAHDVMIGNWTPTPEQEANGLIPGFGATINIINGGIECNSGTENTKVLGRIGHYDRFTNTVGIGMALDGSDNPVELGCANMPAFQIQYDECETNSVGSISISNLSNGQVIQHTLGETITVNISENDPDNTISNIALTIGSDIFQGNVIDWTPASFGDFTLTATAIADGETITSSIIVTLIDATTATGCEGVDGWNANLVYGGAGNEVTYQGKRYQNKWWTQGDTPGETDVWEYIGDCGASTTSAPTITFNNIVDNQIFEFETLENINISFTVTDLDDDLASVVANINGAQQNLNNLQDDYTIDFAATSFGDYSLQIIATDLDGNESTETLSFELNEITFVGSSPSLEVVRPLQNQISMETLQDVIFEVKAEDVDNDLSYVDISVNGNLVNVTQTGSDMYSTTITPTVYGTYTINATAVDAQGLSSQLVFNLIIANPNGNANQCGYASWEAQVYATPGTQVFYNGKIYENQWYAESYHTPGEAQVWKQIDVCGDGPDYSASCGFEPWDSNKVYDQAGITVYYNQALYRSKWWTQGDTPNSSDVWEFVDNCLANTSSSTNRTSLAGVVSPNPVGNTLNFKTDLEVNAMTVYDLNGGQKSQNMNSKTINTSSLAKGQLYVLHVLYTNGNVEEHKFYTN